jgi:hypothetical protein
MVSCAAALAANLRDVRVKHHMAHTRHLAQNLKASAEFARQLAADDPRPKPKIKGLRVALGKDFAAARRGADLDARVRKKLGLSIPLKSEPAPAPPPRRDVGKHGAKHVVGGKLL